MDITAAAATGQKACELQVFSCGECEISRTRKSETEKKEATGWWLSFDERCVTES